MARFQTLPMSPFANPMRRPRPQVRPAYNKGPMRMPGGINLRDFMQNDNGFFAENRPQPVRPDPRPMGPGNPSPPGGEGFLELNKNQPPIQVFQPPEMFRGTLPLPRPTGPDPRPMRPPTLSQPFPVPDTNTFDPRIMPSPYSSQSGGGQQPGGGFGIFNQLAQMSPEQYDSGMQRYGQFQEQYGGGQQGGNPYGMFNQLAQMSPEQYDLGMKRYGQFQEQYGNSGRPTPPRNPMAGGGFIPPGTGGNFGIPNQRPMPISYGGGGFGGPSPYRGGFGGPSPYSGGFGRPSPYSGGFGRPNPYGGGFGGGFGRPNPYGGGFGGGGFGPFGGGFGPNINNMSVTQGPASLPFGFMGGATGGNPGTLPPQISVLQEAPQQPDPGAVGQAAPQQQGGGGGGMF